MKLAPLEYFIAFVVIDGNMFAYVDSRIPNSGQILASKVGAVSHWINGSYPLSPRNHRPATLVDFTRFGIDPTPYREDKLILHVVPTN